MFFYGLKSAALRKHVGSSFHVTGPFLMAAEYTTSRWKALVTCYDWGGAYKADAALLQARPLSVVTRRTCGRRDDAWSIIMCLDYKQPNQIARSQIVLDSFIGTSIAPVVNLSHERGSMLTA